MWAPSIRLVNCTEESTTALLGFLVASCSRSSVFPLTHLTVDATPDCYANRVVRKRRRELTLLLYLREKRGLAILEQLTANIEVVGKGDQSWFRARVKKLEMLPEFNHRRARAYSDSDW